MSAVEFEQKGNVAVITLNRPEARNAVNGEIATGMEEALDRLECEKDLWVGVLCGNGPVFCAGADLKAINEGRAAEVASAKGGFGGIVARERTKPLIAAVDGPALAGGTEICLACDLIVASKQARFGVPEVKRSLAAAAGALFRLPRVLPRNVATELLVTGDPISAERAHHFGMVNVLCEAGEALDKAMELASRISCNAPLAVRETLICIRELEMADDRTAFHRSTEAMMTLAGTEDFFEGPLAFIEKRDPVWKGK